jgi:hypothetical protein
MRNAVGTTGSPVWTPGTGAHVGIASYVAAIAKGNPLLIVASIELARIPAWVAGDHIAFEVWVDGVKRANLHDYVVPTPSVEFAFSVSGAVVVPGLSVGNHNVNAYIRYDLVSGGTARGVTINSSNISVFEARNPMGP